MIRVTYLVLRYPSVCAGGVFKWWKHATLLDTSEKSDCPADDVEEETYQDGYTDNW